MSLWVNQQYFHFISLQSFELNAEEIFQFTIMNQQFPQILERTITLCQINCDLAKGTSPIYI